MHTNNEGTENTITLEFFFPDKSPTDAASSTGAIAGGVIGAVVGVAVIVTAAVIMYYIISGRRKGSINL